MLQAKFDAVCAATPLQVPVFRLTRCPGWCKQSGMRVGAEMYRKPNGSLLHVEAGKVRGSYEIGASYLEFVAYREVTGELRRWLC